ncbi:protein-disulfide reductase DsbD [Ostreibacterium oceani]|uniref:Protein-disulfide reductase DsbD n=1 Tax=Ostreibacterium oceani TaxID=2654998 RepID=A0A6N7EY68_9GAMM|nr:protein-disulfide reductase DsbD [Ostreibacterium oceani]MPV86329.1 protein-disulfide reductase DsbD [Ostreibacterium oceani]
MGGDLSLLTVLFFRVLVLLSRLGVSGLSLARLGVSGLGLAKLGLAKSRLLILATVSLGSMQTGLAQTSVLPADTVFVPTVEAVTENQLTLAISVKPGYYVYASRMFALTLSDKKTGNQLLGDQVQATPTVGKDDPYFGQQAVWMGGDDPIRLTYQLAPVQSGVATLVLKYQGCETGGICYPPQEKQFTIAATTKTGTAQPNSQARIDAGTSIFTTTQTGVASASASSASTSSAASPASSSVAQATTTTALFDRTASAALLGEDEAFSVYLDAIDATTYALRWQVAPAYYLYRDKTFVDLLGDARIINVAFSEGEIHEDAFFGQQVVYRDNAAQVTLTLDRPLTDFRLNIQFQGCADVGVCYPVTARQMTIVDGQSIDLKPVDSVTNGSVNRAGGLSGTDSTGGIGASRYFLADTLKQQVVLGVVLLFVAGLALAFTPCVLPMLPILMGIITNQRQVTRKKAGILAFAYALGVAVMMAVFGLIVAATGINLQIIFQQPIWLLLFAGLFIAMGLAMLGVFSITTPGIIQQRVIGWQQRLQNANVFSLFIIGALSTLIVGPCVAPPLIAILAFISVTNDSGLGALYLFSLGMGMSLPLVAFATVMPVIPKTGALSRLITRLFALLMFGVAIWLMSRLLSGGVALAVWGVYLLVVATVLWHHGLSRVWINYATNAIAVGVAAIGVVWLIGGLMGNSHPLKPLTKLHYPEFVYVNSMDDLMQQLVTVSGDIDKDASNASSVSTSSASGLVMLDFYADWCVACQEIEHITLTDPIVHEALDGVTLLKLDITQTTPAHREMMRQLHLIGPPAMLFFDQTQEINQARHIGVISAVELRDKIQQLKTRAEP